MMCNPTGIYQTQMSGGAGGVAGGGTSSTPTLSSASLDVVTGPRTGGTRVVVTGASGIDVGATCTLGGVAHGVERISSTSFAFVTRLVEQASIGAKDLVVTNPNTETATKSSAFAYTGEGCASYTTWADFITALDEGAEGFTAILTSTLGIVASAKVAKGDAVFNFSDWIDLRLASTTLLTEMFTTVFGVAFTALTPHASTGGLVLNCGTDAQGSVVLDDVQCDGAYRGIVAEIVWDTIDDASIGNNKGFCAGFRARGIADTSTTLRGGGPAKTSANTYRWSYCFNSLQGFTVTNSSAAISAGAINSNGVVCTCFYHCAQNGNLNSGTGDAGVDVAGGSVPTQTAGPAVATGNNTVVHTDRTDLQPVFCNNAVDGSNVIRLIRFKLFGDFSKF